MRLRNWTALLVLLAAAVARGDLPATPKTLNSRHYRIAHDAADDEAAALGAHLDLMYECLAKMMAGIADPPPSLRLGAALFRTRQEYIEFLDDVGIDGRNTGGIFIETRRKEGLLATYINPSSVVETQRTLQHEATHQYMNQALKLTIPQWLDEGLATYFEDGCLVDGELWTGLADVEKIDYLKADLRKGLTMDVPWFFRCTNGDWNSILERDTVNGQRLYDRAWSFVYYMQHGENGIHRQQFWGFVKNVADGMGCSDAYAMSFRSFTPLFAQHKWEQWLKEVQPDPISSALQRAEHLARALRILQLAKSPLPLDVRDLPELLRGIDYEDGHIRGGHRVVFTAEAQQLYLYPGTDGRDHPFVLEPSDTAGMPPVVKAPLLNPQPLAWWAKGADGAVKLHVTLAKVPTA